jgi:hypothetical protein
MKKLDKKKKGHEQNRALFGGAMEEEKEHRGRI